MGLTQTLLLGFIAGVTILVGLPLGRIRRPAPALRLFLTATAVGVLLFLVWDILSQAWEPVDGALTGLHDRTGTIGPVIGYGTLFAAGLAVGMLSLVGYERVMARRAAAVKEPKRFGPGAMAAAEAAVRPTAIGWSAAEHLALLIAVGIGLHNFAEGLAIGQSAGRGEIALATLLVVGFALHNATEGFGIVAPLAADVRPAPAGPDTSAVQAEDERRRPSWGFLLLLGLIGGGPTFVGTAIGHGFTSAAMSVIFLTLAAGSILYVVVQLLGIAARARRPDLLAYGLLLGLLAGFVTDAIVTAAGV